MLARTALLSATFVFALGIFGQSSLQGTAQPTAQTAKGKAMFVIHGGAGTITRKSMSPELEQQYVTLELEEPDLEGLAAGATLLMAASLSDVPPDFLPALLRERMSEAERAAFEKAVAAGAPPAAPNDCVNALRRLRLERDRAAVQEEIDRLEERGQASNDALAALWAKKMELVQRLEALKFEVRS